MSIVLGMASPDVFHAIAPISGGHDWPGSSGNMDIDTSEEIWKFFSTYIKSRAITPKKKISKI